MEKEEICANMKYKYLILKVYFISYLILLSISLFVELFTETVLFYGIKFDFPGFLREI